VVKDGDAPTHDDPPQFLIRLGHQVRTRRRAAGLTAAALAERAGVSRRNITLIEQGMANPSLVTVDKLARALGVDFVALAGGAQAGAVHLSDPAIEVWHGDDGSVGLLHVGSSHIGGPELWEWRLQPGGHYKALPDPEGSEELFLVLSGRLRIETEGQSHFVDSGRSARLASDRPYSYHSDGDEDVVFVRVVRVTQPEG
jgi:transcriptional regulator with XRE-family HTH domain